MKDKFKPVTDENPMMIVLGIIAFYGLIAGFIFYLYFIHRITLIPAILSILIFTIIYLPRFWIIKKLQTKDNIKILEDSIIINGYSIPFSQIKDFRTEDKKPQVVFFLNNKMVVHTFILKSLSQMQLGNLFTSGKICNCSGKFKNSIVSPA